MLRDPNSFQLLADETRRKIIYLLRAKQMTVSQIASELGLTPQAIYHHIRKMKDAEMVEVAREERIDHFIETYYQATAEVFHFSHGDAKPGGGSEAEAQVLEGLKMLPKLGFDIQANEDIAKKISAVDKKISDLMHKQSFTDKAGALDGDFFAKQGAAEYAMFLGMSDKEFEEFCSANQEMRKILKAALASGKARKKA